MKKLLLLTITLLLSFQANAVLRNAVINAYAKSNDLSLEGNITSEGVQSNMGLIRTLEGDYNLDGLPDVIVWNNMVDCGSSGCNYAVYTSDSVRVCQVATLQGDIDVIKPFKFVDYCVSPGDTHFVTIPNPKAEAEATMDSTHAKNGGYDSHQWTSRELFTFSRPNKNKEHIITPLPGVEILSIYSSNCLFWSDEFPNRTNGIIPKNGYNPIVTKFTCWSTPGGSEIIFKTSHGKQSWNDLSYYASKMVRPSPYF